MDATPALAPAARIDRLLRSEPVVWMSTVRPDGVPHLIPIWFSWDGEAILIASKPAAQKVRNIRENPVVMLALGRPDADFDVGLLEGRAELLDVPSSELLPASHLAKYRAPMAAIGLTPDEFLATYTQVSGSSRRATCRGTAGRSRRAASRTSRRSTGGWPPRSGASPRRSDRPGRRRRSRRASRSGSAS